MLHLHRSERADALVVPLAQVLAVPPADPFAVDVVAVPTRGVERWLAQRLSHHLGTGPGGEGGIAANISFESPGRIVDDVLRAVDGRAVDGRATDESAWDRDRLVWRVLEIIDECAGEPWCTALGRHLGVTLTDQDDPRRGRRLRAAQHLAALYTSYGTQRPTLLVRWAAGVDEDGAGAPLPSDLTWQAELWRRLRRRLGEPSPGERLEELIGRLRERPDAVVLPERLSVFGPTRLSAGRLRVLEALAEHRDVHLWLPHPSPALWAAVAQSPAPAGGRRREVQVPAAHPLLASMARDATELQLRLIGSPNLTDTHHPGAAPPDTLLGALQRRLRDDAADVDPHPLRPGDRSVQVHACHGRARQVEVLREALIGLFDDDPSLEPRDVIVMCPDIEAVAPLVAATFGLAVEDLGGQAHPGRSLRVRLADRSLRQTNPLLSLLSRLLELADGRVTASDVVDLTSAEPVRRRFRLDDDDVERIRTWAVTAGARWGEDAARRARFGLGHVRQGTWEAALDRLLLGAAMAEEGHRYVGSALPLDDVDSTDIELAGRLAEIVDRLVSVLGTLDGSRPVGAWLDALDRALDLLAATAPADSWQEVEARAVISGARATVEDPPALAGTELRLADVRALLGRRLQGRPTRAGFRTGALTMCSMEPMRAVPHRVVVLLGMDDGAFPRGSGTDGDDVLLRDPLIGERDRRSEDRQLFLDAVTAATEHLLVLYSGADERTGAPKPPAVPVGELLDALDAAATTGLPAGVDGDPGSVPVRDVVVVRHPLQTVAERNFAPGALGRPGPFSYDAVAHRAAVGGRDRHGDVPFLSARLPAPGAGPVDLGQLIKAVEHPVQAFLRRSLGVQLPVQGEDVRDDLPLALDGLQRWTVGDALLRAALAGEDLGQVATAERLRGVVPPGALGGTVLRAIREDVVPLVDATLQRRPAVPATALDRTVALPSGRELSGTVTGLHGTVLVRPVYSKLSAKYRLRSWVQLLVLAAAEPDGVTGAVTIGRSPRGWASTAVSTLRAPDADLAREILDQLVALHDLALREPLPLPLATACAYAQTIADGQAEPEALARARTEWTGAFEATDDWHTLVWGEGRALDTLLAEPPRPGEDWTPDGTRFGVLARRLWDPLHAHETVEHQ